MITTLTLHAGAAKTGSSAIQTAFVRERAALADCGVYYPASETDTLAETGRPTAGNGAALARALMDHELSDAAGDQLIDQWFKELSAAGHFKNVLVSSEWFADVPTDRLARLGATARDHNVRLKIIYYVRHIADHALAVYSDRVWRRGETASFEEFCKDYQCPFRDDLDSFSAAFGADAVSAHVYDDHRQALVHHIMDCVGAKDADALVQNDWVNRSLSRIELEIIRRLQARAHDLTFVTRLAAEHAFQTRGLPVEHLTITPAELEQVEQRWEGDIRYINRTYLTGMEKLNSCSDHLAVEEYRDPVRLSEREKLMVTMLEAALTAHDDMVTDSRAV